MHFGLLFILGFCIFGGMFGGYIFQRIKIPQVVGYIAVGLLIGQSGFQLVTAEEIQKLESINLFALGIIGFLVGGELELENFRKYGKQFSSILISEGISAFLLVGASTFAVVWFVAGLPLSAALASAIVFGAIASATDPASTINVLWEYKAAGVLTMSLTAIVALDDALAMTVYGFGTSAVEMITHSDQALWPQIQSVLIELGGAVGTGIVFALILAALLKMMHEVEKIAVMTIGLVFLIVALSNAAGMDIILASMLFGFGLRNLAPYRSEGMFSFLKNISVVIYVLFFVFVGARIELSAMPLWLWMVVLGYVVFRTIGKWGGAMLGAKISGSEENIRKYLGMGLFSQGGVAIGLSIMAGHHLSHIQVTESASLGELIISGITATTLIVQVLGPPFVKLAITKAGEQNRKITEEDVIAGMSLDDIMITDPVTLTEEMPLGTAIEWFGRNPSDVLPVVDSDGRLTGIFTLDSFKQVISNEETWKWLLVSDTMFSLRDSMMIENDLTAADAYAAMKSTHLDYVVVVGKDEPARLHGLVEMKRIKTAVNEWMLSSSA
ncbi:MAG: cation:proton antiporter [Spirochaetales bacterium]|nr:cation:proton antiporter [Spirochaetales bacterium]MCF7938237.1 cation:proton antiporter [Spirochaetales bacterium]